MSLLLQVMSPGDLIILDRKNIVSKNGDHFGKDKMLIIVSHVGRSYVNTMGTNRPIIRYHGRICASGKFENIVEKYEMGESVDLFDAEIKYMSGGPFSTSSVYFTVPVVGFLKDKCELNKTIEKIVDDEEIDFCYWPVLKPRINLFSCTTPFFINWVLCQMSYITELVGYSDFGTPIKHDSVDRNINRLKINSGSQLVDRYSIFHKNSNVENRSALIERVNKYKTIMAKVGIFQTIHLFSGVKSCLANNITFFKDVYGYNNKSPFILEIRKAIQQTSKTISYLKSGIVESQNQEAL